MHEPVILELAAPPSSNRWWRRAGHRMHLSHEAEDYKKFVAWKLRGMGVANGAPVFPTEQLSVVIVWRRDRKSGDLDKRLGVILDALQETTIDGVHLPGLYASDAQVVQIWARRCDEHPQLAPGTIRVEVCANDPQPV